MRVYNPQPILDLLGEEDPLEIANCLDEMLNIMVQYHEHECSKDNLANRYHMLQLLRNTFRQTTKCRCYED